LRISLICVGKLGRSPEAVLAAAYAERASAAGRSLALGPVEIREVEGRKPGKPAEADAILERLAGGPLIACDEHGEGLASREIAKLLERFRDDGARELAFAVGGANGMDDRVRNAARSSLAFGPQTWPHALVRVMLAEQIYRAISILGGGPYHRD